MFHETDRSDEVLGNEVEYTCKAGILAVGQACDMLQESSIALASLERDLPFNTLAFLPSYRPSSDLFGAGSHVRIKTKICEPRSNQSGVCRLY